ncbi:urease accessory protein UreF [Paenibacillus sp. CC-CFT747]|nr:urease accessory protein UreF [Paenibacillus sp. CC-CFT747]
MENSAGPAWLSYLQLLDSALPIGGFSHSFGLETLVQTGAVSRAGQLREYIETMLHHSWAPVDAMAVKAVYAYVPRQEWGVLWRVDHRLHVQRTASETRDGVAKMGRRLYSLTRSLYPALPWGPLHQAIQDSRCPGTHPLIHGWVSFYLDVPLAMAVEGYLYTCVQTCINSGLRLMAIGQTEGQRLLASLLPVITEAWKEAEGLDPAEDGFGSVPQADLAMIRHESLYSRLFMS